MHRTHTQGSSARRGGLARGLATAAFGLLALGTFAACSSVTDSLLEADDPDLIAPENLNSPDAAVGLYRGALERFRTISAGGESTWLYGGLLADEWGTSSTFIQNDEADTRNVRKDNSVITGMYRSINRVRTASNQAIAKMREFFPTPDAAARAQLAELYFARGFAEMQLAQDFCGAIPLSDAAGDEVLLVGPSTTAEVFAKAVASYDSALAILGSATDAAGVRVANAARIGKARALLALGPTRYAEAATAVAGIATSYSYDHTFATTSGDNTIWSQVPSSRRYLVGDSLEGNSRSILVRNNIPFFSSKDPRLPSTFTISANGRDTTKSQDGSTLSRTTTLYGRSTPVAVVNGIDARLVEAEARLAANDAAGMLTILNALRAAPPKIGDVQPTAAQLPPLTLPATKDAQVNLLFREKAFWTFSRGQRLGDLRRLIRDYGRTAATTFPVGDHYRGGTYGNDVNFQIPEQEDQNPQFVRASCDVTKA